MKFFKGIPITLLYVTIYTLVPPFFSFLKLPPQYGIVIQLPILLLLFTSVLFGKHKQKMMYPTNLMNMLYLLYAILCVIMFLRGYNIDERGGNLNFNGKLYVMFGNGLYILWTLIPIVVLRSYPYYQLKHFSKLGMYICVFFTLLTILNIPSLIASSHSMALGFDNNVTNSYGRIPELFAPMLMFLIYLSKRERLVYLICFLINVLVLILMARRGALLMFVLLLFCSFILIYRNLSIKQKVIVLFSFICLSVIGLLKLFDSDIFSYLQARGLEDTRANVNQALLEQMTPIEMIFGKGLNGRYYLPLRIGEFYDGWRYGCETGFLDIVLKGGLLMAIVYIMLLLIPALQGIFKSNNIFCRGGGIYILWSLIYLYPFGVLDFNISFFFIWMWVILCSMPTIRKMTDSEIKHLFFK